MLAAGANLSKMTVEDSKSRRECTQAGVTPFVVFFSGGFAKAGYPCAQTRLCAG